MEKKIATTLFILWASFMVWIGVSTSRLQDEHDRIQAILLRIEIESAEAH